MTIELRLFAALREYLPSGKTSCRLEMPPGTTIADVLAHLGIPPDAVHMALVNGDQELDFSRPLDHDCVLSAFPPVAGG